MELRTPLLLREPPRSRVLGLIVSIGSVALCTPSVYPLKTVAPAVSLGVVYLLARDRASRPSGDFGLASSRHSLSAARLQLLPHPAGRAVHDRGGAELGRAGCLLRRGSDREHARGVGAQPRPGGGGAAPGGGPDGRARPHPARRTERRCSAARRRRADRPRRSSCPRQRCGSREAPTIRAGCCSRFPTTGTPLGTLVVPAGIDPEHLARLRERLVPGLEALLAAAIDREALIDGDGRDRGAAPRATTSRPPFCAPSPTTCAPRSPRSARRPRRSARRRSPSSDRRELRGRDRRGPERLASLVDNLLDLSRLRAGTAEPSRDWTLDRGGDRGGARRPRARARPRSSSPSTTRPALHPGRLRPARAGVRQPARRTRRATPAASRSRSVRARSRAGS